MRWERLGAQSSRWTTGLGDQGFTVGLIVFTLLHFLLSVHFPLAEDELYYWSWARDLQWSYFDHPPMVAYLIRFSTAIFGNNAFGIRFFSVLSGTLILWVLGHRMTGRGLILALACTPVVAVLSLYMTPDIPLIAFWLLYAQWAAAVNRRLQEWGNDPVQRVYHQSPIPASLWAVGGLLLGLGMLSKYTMALAPLCFGLLCLMNYRLRAWISGFALHLSIAFLVSLPILVYNLQTGFLPLRFQWGHSLGASAPPAFWNFMTGQLALVGALPFLMAPWIVAFRRRLCAIPELQVAYYFFIPPLTFFLIQAARAPMEGNWSLVAYVLFWPLAHVLLSDNSFKTAGRILVLLTMAPAFAVTLGLLIHSFHPLAVVPIEKDRLVALRGKQAAVEKLAADFKTSHAGQSVFSPTYQWTSYLRYAGLPVRPLPLGRMNHFRMRDAGDVCAETQAFVLVEGGAVDPLLSCFPNREELEFEPIVIRGKTVGNLTLQRFSRALP